MRIRPFDPDWIEIHDAMARVIADIRPLDTERVALQYAFGRTLAAQVTSPIDQPPWDNSAMDGYAVRGEDVVSASEERPVELTVLEHIAAGAFPSLPVSAGQATRIMTGAPLPQGADCVIRIEHTSEANGKVVIRDDLDAGRNVRKQGEDIRAGAAVMAPGRVLRAGEIGALATVGCAEVEVYRRPEVAILSTGDELVDLGAFDEVVAGRRIANSNSYALAAAVQATGAIARVLGIARDEPEDLRRYLQRAAGADALVTTAGASVGDHDIVKVVLDELDFRRGFWRVRMRPGSPFSFGWLTLEGRPLPVFGLPGNPVSALVTFELFVRPALRRMQGRADVYGPVIRVRAGTDIPSKAGLTHFLRVRLFPQQDGVPEARLTGEQGSGMVTSMAEADALLVVPEQRDGLAEGELAWALRLPRPDEAQTDPGF